MSLSRVNGVLPAFASIKAFEAGFGAAQEAPFRHFANPLAGHAWGALQMQVGPLTSRGLFRLFASPLLPKFIGEVMASSGSREIVEDLKREFAQAQKEGSHSACPIADYLSAMIEPAGREEMIRVGLREMLRSRRIEIEVHTLEAIDDETARLLAWIDAPTQLPEKGPDVEEILGEVAGDLFASPNRGQLSKLAAEIDTYVGHRLADEWKVPEGFSGTDPWDIAWNAYLNPYTQPIEYARAVGIMGVADPLWAYIDIGEDYGLILGKATRFHEVIHIGDLHHIELMDLMLSQHPLGRLPGMKRVFEGSRRLMGIWSETKARYHDWHLIRKFYVPHWRLIIQEGVSAAMQHEDPESVSTAVETFLADAAATAQMSLFDYIYKNATAQHRPASSSPLRGTLATKMRSRPPPRGGEPPAPSAPGGDN